MSTSREARATSISAFYTAISRPSGGETVALNRRCVDLCVDRLRFMRKTAQRSSSSPELATRAAPTPPDMSDTAPLGVDDALERAGGWSTFQWRLMGALGACTSSAATHMLQPIFLMPLMDWPDVSSVQVGLTSSLFFAGVRGRRVRVGGVLGAAAPPDDPRVVPRRQPRRHRPFFAPTFHTFLALRCLCGFGVGGLKNAVFLLGTEFAPPAARAQVSALVSYFWLGGLLWLVGCAYLLGSLVEVVGSRAHPRALSPGAPRNSAQFYAALPILLAASSSSDQALIVQPAYLPESPRFLLVAGEVERAARRETCLQGERRRRQAICLQQPAASGASHSTIAQLWRKDAPRDCGHRILAGRLHDDGAPPPPPPPPPPLPPPPLLHHLLSSRSRSPRSRFPRSSTS